MPPRTPPPPRHAAAAPAPAAAPPRKPGKRGRLPQRAAGDRLALKFVHEYAAEALPEPSYPVDVTGGITDWGMLGNGPDPTCTTHPDGVGDCTYAGRQHLKMAKNAAAGTTETWETSNELVAEYLAYDHGQDDGAVIADLLLAWYKAGKILGFAPVDHSGAARVDAAMQAFHGVYCGVDLTDDADDLFEEGRPWGTGSVTPDPDDGHCVVKFKADGKSRDGYGTWGSLQEATLTWSASCVVETWVIITTEDEARKINMEALIADIEALGGHQDVPAQNKPAPAPAPAAGAKPAEDTKMSPAPDVAPPPRDPKPEAVPAASAASTAEPIPATLPDPGRTEDGVPAEPVAGTLPDPSRKGDPAPEPAGPTPPPQAETGISPPPSVSPPQRAPVHADAGLRGELEEILGRLRDTADGDLHQVVGFLRSHRFGSNP